MRPMMDAEERIKALVQAGRAHKLVTGGARDITRLLGVAYACARLNLTEEDTEGYDARDAGNLRVQIKSRAPEKQQYVNHVGTVGSFTNFKFDYALLVMMDGDFELHEIWRAAPASLEPLHARLTNPHRGIRVGDFLKVGKRVF